MYNVRKRQSRTAREAGKIMRGTEKCAIVLDFKLPTFRKTLVLANYRSGPCCILQIYATQILPKNCQCCECLVGLYGMLYITSLQHLLRS